MKTDQTLKLILFLAIFLVIISIISAQQTLYCTASAVFKTNLDSEQGTCEAATVDGTANGEPLVWTGSFCCSEDDDPNEFYNDFDGSTIGGCFNKKFAANDEFVDRDLDGSISVSEENLIVLDGGFFGCNIGAGEVVISNFNNADVLDINDNFNSQDNLVLNVGSCFQKDLSLLGFYCSTNGTWQPANGINRSHLNELPTNLPDQGFQREGCCQVNQCWNGAFCVGNQIENPDDATLLPNITAGNSFRCFDGEWVESPVKIALIENKEGFCQSDTQCLVKVNGNFADNNNTDLNPQCILDGQFIEIPGEDDNYCEGGIFTSRAKLLSLKLTDIAANNDHTIFCDNPANTLIALDYQVGSQLNINVQSIVDSDTTSNFCVLILEEGTNQQIIIGTPLTVPLQDTNNNFLQILGLDDCQITNDDLYHPCLDDNSDEVWYNDELQIIIYSDSLIPRIGLNQNDLGISSTSLLQFLLDLFGIVIGDVTTVPVAVQNEFIEDLGKFERLYISKSGTREISGTIESGTGFRVKNILIEYSGFSTDICSLVNAFNTENNGNQDSFVQCQLIGSLGSSSRQIVFGKGSSLDNINPDEFWSDFTSKLRIS